MVMTSSLRFHWRSLVKEARREVAKTLHGGGIRRWYGNTIRWVDWSRADYYAAHGGSANMRFEGQVGTTTTKIALLKNAFASRSRR